jgi:hypothetical protein
MNRVFIHLPSFEKVWNLLGLTDLDLRKLQLQIMIQPGLGDVVPGTHGIRKLRWAVYGKGKRGGLRIFYVDFSEFGRTYLLTLLRKSDVEDLNEEQRQTLSKMVLQLNRILRN